MSGQEKARAEAGGSCSPKEQKPETITQLCRRIGITRKQAYEWIKLAEAPPEKFEELLASPDVYTMRQRYRAIVKAPTGGRGRPARPALRLLDSLLALELEFASFDAAALHDLDGSQLSALVRVVSSLIASLPGWRGVLSISKEKARAEAGEDGCALNERSAEHSSASRRAS